MWKTVKTTKAKCINIHPTVLLDEKGIVEFDNGDQYLIKHSDPLNPVVGKTYIIKEQTKTHEIPKHLKDHLTGTMSKVLIVEDNMIDKVKAHRQSMLTDLTNNFKEMSMVVALVVMSFLQAFNVVVFINNINPFSITMWISIVIFFVLEYAIFKQGHKIVMIMSKKR